MTVDAAIFYQHRHPSNFVLNSLQKEEIVA